jgi:AraC family transcriptional regulator
MSPVSSESWCGLPIYICDHREGDSGSELDVSYLLLWQEDGNEVEIRHGHSRRWTYAPHAGRFDILPQGCFAAARHGVQKSHPWMLALPPCWLSPLVKNATGAALQCPHLQFRDRVLERLVRKLLQTHALGQPHGRLYTESVSTMVAYRLLVCEGRAASGDDGPLPSVVRGVVRRIIDERLDSPPDLETLATLAGLGTAQFLRAFRGSFGVTPHRYVMHRRIDRAKQLLGRSTLPIVSLALDLGFASHAHFTTAFRAHTGMTPSAYRHVSRGTKHELPDAIAIGAVAH